MCTLAREAAVHAYWPLFRRCCRGVALRRCTSTTSTQPHGQLHPAPPSSSAPRLPSSHKPQPPYPPAMPIGHAVVPYCEAHASVSATPIPPAASAAMPSVRLCQKRKDQRLLPPHPHPHRHPTYRLRQLHRQLCCCLLLGLHGGLHGDQHLQRAAQLRRGPAQKGTGGQGRGHGWSSGQRVHGARWPCGGEC